MNRKKARRGGSFLSSLDTARTRGGYPRASRSLFASRLLELHALLPKLCCYECPGIQRETSRKFDFIFRECVQHVSAHTSCLLDDEIRYVLLDKMRDRVTDSAHPCGILSEFLAR